MSDLLELSRIYVRPQNKLQRIGQALMNKAEEECRALNYKGLRLHCFDQNLAAIRFYEKLGYQTTGMAPFEILAGLGRTDVVMTKQLG